MTSLARIVSLAEGTDTMETVRRVAAEGGSVVAVTQWFHLPRAVLMMRRIGMREVSSTWPRFAEVQDTHSFLREAVGRPFYAAKPHVASMRPASGAERTLPA